ncbi:MAG: diguanylate cyclase, partial [Gemmatirosa sp.]|nr:diguanylate cyclase [Gemmatirosa sp.]
SHQFSWAAYVVVYSQYPLTLWALASFPRAGQEGVSRRTYLFDSAIVLVAGAVLAWHFVFREILAQSGAGPLATVRALAYPALCLSVLSAAVTLFLRRPAPRLVVPLGILTAAWVFWGLANTLQMRATVLDTSLNEVTFNVCFATGAWLVTLAAVVFRGRAPRADAAGARASDAAPSYSFLPYAAIAGVYGVLLLQARRATLDATPRATAPLIALVLGAIAITVIVVLRQGIAQRRNAALVAERLRAEAHFRALVQHGSDVILVVDAEGVVREASPSVAHTLGRAPETLVGRALADLVVPADRAVVRADLAQMAAAAQRGARPSPSAPCEWRVPRGEGETRWLEVLCTNLLHDPAVRGIVVNGRDVSEHKALEAELTRQAHHDSLTGLVNRARFRQLVEEALRGRRGADAEDDGRGSLAVLYVDLDDFKPVNDSLGHGAGDRVLSVVTERLRDATRGSDVVARLGGDEFAVLLEHVRDAEEAAAVARRAIERLQLPIVVDGVAVVIGASIGIACTSAGRRDDPAARAATCEALLHNADAAMYAAKAQGGRRFVVHGPHAAEC